MKKILIIGGSQQPIPPVKGGAVENLIKMFYDLNEKLGDFNISIISCKDETIDMSQYNYNKVFFHFVNKGKKYNKLKEYFYIIINKIFKISWVKKSDFVKNSIKYVKSNNIQFDVILVENYVEAILPFKKAFPDKEIYFHLHNDKLNNRILGGKNIVRACKKIITVSDYIKNRVNTINGADNKTVTLINSIDVEKFGTKKCKDNGQVLREKFKVNNDDFLIIFTGRIAKTKGVLELIKAFSMINVSNILLMIIGNSWYGKGIPNDKYVQKLKGFTDSVKDRIIFTGYVDYEKIQDYYAMADLVVIPSIWQEPCSLTLFETMASNVPLISTNTGGTPEIVQNKAKLLLVDENFIFNLKNEIENVYKNYDISQKMAKEAYCYIQKYNSARYYNELSKIIKGEK